ncbi:tail assembly protein [Pseudomonas sp. ANT_J12]|uniref:tail assembly protein n=1 Tax=Pseudomonas sp. ANT_J12 TaxID=2597351 RepID=UPI0011F0FFF9|nr:tail assembly protein [Pseudomonas sp. ANT_J12]KAA0995429.1 tail assembly protein [Pseudomonas sp. ANT_J12]
MPNTPTQPASDRIRTVRLHGVLGKRFGHVHHLAVNSAGEAVRALGVLHKGFNRFLTESKDKGMAFAVFYGKRNISKNELGDPPSHNDIRISPIVKGSKNGGGLQTVLGIALIVAASFFGTPASGAAVSGAMFGGGVWGVVGAVGISLAIGGVAQMVAGTAPGIDSSEAADNQPSYNFSGIKNTVTQGNPVPLCYGEMVVGSACVSLGVVAEDQQ